MEVIPAINAENFEEIQGKIKEIEPFIDWVQLDVADGTFTKNTIWHNPNDLLGLETPLNIEVHLMLNDIEKRIGAWLIPEIKRVIFHIETAKDPDWVIEKIKKAGKEPGMAAGPDTPWTKLAHYRGKINFFQILGVRPGLAGQKMEEETYEQIKQLRKFCDASPSGRQFCIIEIDGGVNKENAKRLADAGADIIVAASAIFNGDIKNNIKELNNAVK